MSTQIDSSIYDSYSHLSSPIQAGSLVWARGKESPIQCEVVRLMADGLYVVPVGAGEGCKYPEGRRARLTALLMPHSVFSSEDAAQ